MLGRLFGPLYQCIRALRAHEQTVELIAGRADPTDWDQFIKEAIENIEDIAKLCVALHMPQSANLGNRIIKRLSHKTNVNEIKVLLGALRDLIHGEGEQLFVFHIPPRKGETIKNIENDWEFVKKKFPSAASEINSACSCFAFGESTASVFHLMRIAEIGLRALARERRVRIPRKNLDWAGWQEILTHLGKKVDEFGKRKAGPTKDAALAFYQGALGEFAAFKDPYRNVVMHVRKTYDEHEAASAMLHVREFMARLAKRLGETDRTAIKWGRF